MSHATKNAIVKIGASIENAIFNKKPSNEKSENRDNNQIAGHDADEFGRRRLFFENDEVFNSVGTKLGLFEFKLEFEFEFNSTHRIWPTHEFR